MPDFWLGLILIVVFAVNLGWFPPTGYVPWGDGIGGWLQSITLPVITLAVPASGTDREADPGCDVDCPGGEYVRTLRAAGVGERSIVLRHGLRNAPIRSSRWSDSCSSGR